MTDPITIYCRNNEEGDRSRKGMLPATPSHQENARSASTMMLVAPNNRGYTFKAEGQPGNEVVVLVVVQIEWKKSIALSQVGLIEIRFRSVYSGSEGGRKVKAAHRSRSIHRVQNSVVSFVTCSQR